MLVRLPLIQSLNTVTNTCPGNRSIHHRWTNTHYIVCKWHLQLFLEFIFIDIFPYLVRQWLHFVFFLVHKSPKSASILIIVNFCNFFYSKKKDVRMEKGMVINLRLFFSSKKWTGIKTINKLSVHFSKENNWFHVCSGRS